MGGGGKGEIVRRREVVNILIGANKTRQRSPVRSRVRKTLRPDLQMTGGDREKGSLNNSTSPRVPGGTIR